MNMEETFPYSIRWAHVTDYEKTMDMVWETFLKFEGKDYTQEGIANFEEFIRSDTLYQSFLIGSYQMLVAICEGEIIGMASVRNRNHLSLLFVKEEFHRKGVGRRLMQRLFDYLKEEQGEKEMTVWAAPYAVSFYEKLEFRPLGPEQVVDGIRITTMKKTL